MIQLYERAKARIPELRLQTSSNRGELYLGDCILMSSEGANYQSQIEVYLSGLLAGCEISLNILKTINIKKA